MVPSWFVSLVLALGIYRVVRIVGWDDFPPMVKLRDRATGKKQSRGPYVDGDHFDYARPLLAHFIGCGFCIGFHLSVIVFIAWRFAPTETVYALAPFALSAAVGLIASRLDP